MHHSGRPRGSSNNSNATDDVTEDTDGTGTPVSGYRLFTTSPRSSAAATASSPFLGVSSSTNSDPSSNAFALKSPFSKKEKPAAAAIVHSDVDTDHSFGRAFEREFVDELVLDSPSAVGSNTGGSSDYKLPLAQIREARTSLDERDDDDDDVTELPAAHPKTTETPICDNSDSGSESDSEEEAYRFVYLNDPDANAALLYCSNRVVTSRFTLYNFLPKLLFYEFSKLANAYFLVISVMQTIKPISNTGGFPASLPALTIIVLIDMFFACLEDYKRHQADHIANELPCRKFSASSKTFEAAKWSELVVGDVVKLQNREAVPADLVILAASEPDPANPVGICYVETKSLDGETNLKLRQGIEATYTTLLTDADVATVHGVVVCETPNNAIHRFHGSLTLASDSGSASESQKEPITTNSIVLRGSTLRNTEFIYGLVVNTGADTKIMMASSNTPLKWSNMERRLNQQILYICVLMILLCLTGATASNIWNASNLSKNYGDGAWYLFDREATAVKAPVGNFVIQVLYYFLLLNSFIPVSLYVSMTSVKFLQAFFMNNDLEMYHAESDTPCSVRTMSLNEELGQIDYIFSDKTGTLTCNVMEFRKCSINGRAYGMGETEVGLAAKKRRMQECDAGQEAESDDKATPATCTDRVVCAPFVNYQDDALFDAMRDVDSNDAACIQAFFAHLGICHTVMPERTADGRLRLSASSPDEQALVAAAACFGYKFIARTPGKAVIERFSCLEEVTTSDDSTQPNAANKTTTYDVLEVLEFNSTRKRMSVVVRLPSGRVQLLCKGADTVMYERLRATSDPETLRVRQQTLDDMETFASEGLRTLVIASTEIETAKFDQWVLEYRAAINDMKQIELRRLGEVNAIDRLMDALEVDLEILGATAIEDRLQADVPDTIHRLRQASIKIWMLTGDKEETAINIGFACRLLTNDVERIVISADTHPDIRAITDELQRYVTIQTNTTAAAAAAAAATHSDEAVDEAPAKTKRWPWQRATAVSDALTPTATDDTRRLTRLESIAHINTMNLNELALVIDGETLEVALDECPDLLLQVAEQCVAVIACRVSPAQKAQLVRLVRDHNPDVRTLAIGDGANDVSMIQAAHVGVGISGQEGMQAANSSDYAIAQFKFLGRLLLVHGRWNYVRMGKLILYIFYKNVMMNLTQFWYMIFTGFSGQKFFLEWGLQGYNLFFTALPIVLVSTFEQDVPAHLALGYPLLYRIGQENQHFNTKIVWAWISSCVWESLVISFGTLFGMRYLGSKGDTPTMWVYGCTAFSIVLLVVTLKLCLHQQMWWRLHLVVYAISASLWVVTAAVISSGNSVSSAYWNGVFAHSFGTQVFWLLVPLLTFTALSRDVLWKGYIRAFRPSYKHLAQEVHAFKLLKFADQLLAFPPAERMPCDTRDQTSDSGSAVCEQAMPRPSLGGGGSAPALTTRTTRASINDALKYASVGGSGSGLHVMATWPRMQQSPQQPPQQSHNRPLGLRRSISRGSAFSYDAESVMVESFMATERFNNASSNSHHDARAVFERHASRGSMAFHGLPDADAVAQALHASSGHSSGSLNASGGGGGTATGAAAATSAGGRSRLHSTGNIFANARHSFALRRRAGSASQPALPISLVAATATTSTSTPAGIGRSNRPDTTSTSSPQQQPPRAYYRGHSGGTNDDIGGASSSSNNDAMPPTSGGDATTNRPPLHRVRRYSTPAAPRLSRQQSD